MPDGKYTTFISASEEVFDYMSSSKSPFDFNKVFPVPEILLRLHPEVMVIDRQSVATQMNNEYRSRMESRGYRESRIKTRALSRDEARDIELKHGTLFSTQWRATYWGTRNETAEVNRISPTELSYTTEQRQPGGAIDILSREFPTEIISVVCIRQFPEPLEVLRHYSVVNGSRRSYVQPARGTEEAYDFITHILCGKSPIPIGPNPDDGLFDWT